MSAKFSDKLAEVQANIEPLLIASKMLNPEVIEAIKRLAVVDFTEMQHMLVCAEKVDFARKNISQVEQYLPQIRTLAGITDVLKDVDKNQAKINIVSKLKKNIEEVAASDTEIRAILAMKPMIEDILSLAPKLDMVLDVKEELQEVTFIANTLRDQIKQTEKNQERAEKSVEQAANMLGKMNIVEHRIDEKLKEMQRIEKTIKNLTVSVTHVGSEVKPSSRYDNASNTLKLAIPSGREGKKGEKGPRGVTGKQGKPGTASNIGKTGETGRDGENFSIDLYGNKRDLMKYGNRPVGTSFLSLDETPSMIYFRKSNALDHWTDGQPFGVSNGDIKLLVDNAQRLNGFTLEEIFSHVEKSVNNILNSKGQ